MSGSEPVQIPEDKIAGILTRAAELDRVPFMSIDTLRAAAIEAGLSPRAIEQALHEFAASNAVLPRDVAIKTRKSRGLREWLRNLRTPAELGAFGLFLGISSGVAEAMIPLAFVAWAIAAFRLSARERHTGDTGTFNTAMILMMFGLILGHVVAGFDGDVVPGFIAAGAIFTGIGNLFIRVPRQGSEDVVPG